MNETDLDLIPSGNGRMHRRGRTLVDPGESREDKFVRLATARMTKLKATARQLSNLASYPYTDAQRDKIMSELRRVVGDIETAFTKRVRDDLFSF